MDAKQPRRHLAVDIDAGSDGRPRLDPFDQRALERRAVVAELPVRAGVAERGAEHRHDRALGSARSAQALATIRAGMAKYAERLTGEVSHGIKEAFSDSITHMLSRALWIVLLGVAIVAFIPELPLRSHSPAKES